jgi:hypothetical protein
VLSCTITDQNVKPFQTETFIDCGATGDFYDTDSAHKRKLTIYELEHPKRLYLADGSPSLVGDITHATDLEVDISGHKEIRTFFLTGLGRYEVLLGKPWLRKHNPYIDWAQDFLTFDKEFCREHCLPTHTHQICVHGYSGQLSKPLDNFAFPRRVGAAAFHTIANMHGVEIFSLSMHEVMEELKSRGVDPPALSKPQQQKKPPRYSQLRSDAQRKMFYELHSENTGLEQQHDQEQAERQQAAALHLAGFSLEDIQIALQTKKRPDPAVKVPSHYHELLDVFDYKAADTLPPHRDCDHEIKLKPGTTPPHGPLYNMSIEELEVLRKWLDDNLAKGFIRASSSPAAAPVLFAKKPGGGLRFCVDYRGLNNITIKNRYSLPLLQETLARLSTAKYFTKLDIIAAFNHIRIKDGQEWMTAFNTRYGLFETLVMPFGLSNAPATFQARINEVLRPFLDLYCTAYIDDILIYSDNLLEHRQHVKSVLQALREAGLHVDIKKCEFETQEVTYLGMIVSTSGVKMDPSKVSCIVNWEAPSNLKDVQAFLGFSNFYRRFIKGFSRIVKPLNELTKKDVKFVWSEKCQKAFETLKNSFITAPVLRHFDPTKEIFVEADASDLVSSGILSQKDKNGVLHPVAFMSEKFDSAECNYEIYDKELLAVVRCFETWRHELAGASFPITVITDHRNLTYFMTTKQLTQRQMRWSEFLQQFDYVFKAVSGKANRKADSLTRRSQDLPKDLNDERIQYRNRALIKPHNIDDSIKADITPLLPELDLSSIAITEVNLSTRTLSERPEQPFSWELNFAKDIALSPAILSEHDDEPFDHKLTRLLEDGYKVDKWWHKTRDQMLKPEGIPTSKDVPLSECEIRDDRFYFRNRLYVPGRELQTLLIQTAHDSVEGGHPGKNSLFELLSRDYWWRSLHYDVKMFVRACSNCSRNNTSRLRYQGALKPLPLPIQRWRDISVDFVGPLPEIDGYNCIMVVVDRLSKERHYIPCHTTLTAADLAKIFVREVWRLHGLPDSIVSDRGPQFIAEFWKAVCYRLQITASLSTAYHPETDGQTENANAFMEQYLRKYINLAQNDLFDWLPMAEFAANNAVNSSTQISPFFANKGFHPRMSFGPPRPIAQSSPNRLRDSNAAGNDFVTKMADILQILRTNLTAAKAKQEASANANRSPHPAYRVGDEIYLDTRNISTSRPIKKLDHKFIGPFKVKEVLGSHSYKIDLPFEYELMHDVFHPSLLRPAFTTGLLGQKHPPPPPITIDEDGEKLWAIEAILDSKRTTKGPNKGFHYLVLWRGYDPEDQSWEPLKHVVNARASILEFERRFPRKLKPNKTEIDRATKAAKAANSGLLERMQGE